MSTFKKYQTRGAYHWDAISRNPRRHDCFTADRYRASLEAAALKGNEQVVDLGCGDGALTGLIAQQVPRGHVRGVEPEPTGRGLAITMLSTRATNVTILATTNEIPDGSQDVVICSDVIEHVPDPDALLAEMKRMLKVGGRVVLTTPIRLTEAPLDVEHVQEFYPREFVALVEPHFVVHKHDSFCPVFAVELYYWRPWIFLKRGVSRWCMNILSAWFNVRVMSRQPSLGRYYCTQLVVGVRA